MFHTTSLLSYTSIWTVLIDQLACFNAARVVKRHDDVKLYGKLIDQLVSCNVRFETSR